MLEETARKTFNLYFTVDLAASFFFQSRSFLQLFVPPSSFILPIRPRHLPCFRIFSVLGSSTASQNTRARNGMGFWGGACTSHPAGLAVNVPKGISQRHTKAAGKQDACPQPHLSFDSSSSFLQPQP